MGRGYQHPDSDKERSLQPAAWNLETLVSANLLRAPRFLPKETRRDDASAGMNGPLEGLASGRAVPLLGSGSVVASDVYVTFVYNGLFFKQCW